MSLVRTHFLRLKQLFSDFTVRRMMWKADTSAARWASPPECLLQQTWGRAREVAFLVRSQLLLRRRVEEPHFKNHCPRTREWFPV